jgi:hypothetical protein
MPAIERLRAVTERSLSKIAHSVGRDSATRCDLVATTVVAWHRVRTGTITEMRERLRSGAKRASSWLVRQLEEPCSIRLRSSSVAGSSAQRRHVSADETNTTASASWTAPTGRARRVCRFLSSRFPPPGAMYSSANLRSAACIWVSSTWPATGIWRLDLANKWSVGKWSPSGYVPRARSSSDMIAGGWSPPQHCCRSILPVPREVSLNRFPWNPRVKTIRPRISPRPDRIGTGASARRHPLI